MKDVRQIKIIHEALNKQKDRHLYELEKTNASINKKLALIARMEVYQKEYQNSSRWELSQSISTLNQNFYLFAKKIAQVIKQTETEVAGLRNIQSSLLKLIDEIDKKIKLMDVFAEKVKREMTYKMTQQEQVMIDDLAVGKMIRGDND